MIRTNYHIHELHANLNPSLDEPDEVEFAIVGVKIEMGEASYDPESRLFKTDATIDLDLNSTGTNEEEDDQSDEATPEHGEITIELTMMFEYDDDYYSEEFDIEEQVEIWNEEGYKQVSSQLLSQLDSGILPKLLSPLEHLLDDSFIGIIPRYRFTLTEEEEEEYEEGDSESEEAGQS